MMLAEQRQGDRNVRCLRARVQVADTEPEIRRARAQAGRGDAAWRRRLQRYEQGDTLIVALTAFALIDGGGDRPEPLCYCHEVVWLDRPVAPRLLTERLRELAQRDFRTIGPRLRDRGIQLSDAAAVTVQLDIDAAVAQRLDPAAPRPG